MCVCVYTCVYVCIMHVYGHTHTYSVQSLLLIYISQLYTGRMRKFLVKAINNSPSPQSTTKHI